jgi:tetratricopeptide (TPR) repeat protein
VTFLFGINDLDQEEGLSDRAKAALFDSGWLTLRQWLNRSMIVYALRRQVWRARGFFFGKTPVSGRDVEQPGSPPRVSLEEYEQNLKRVAALASGAGFRPLFVIVPTSPYAFDPSLVDDDRSALSTAELRTLAAARGPGARDLAGLAAELEALVAARPGRSEAWHLLARCYQRRGRFAAAQRAFLEAHRRNVFKRYEEVVRRAAAATGTTLVDLSDEFLAARPEPLYVDDMHPNERGHQLIAEALARALAGPTRSAPSRP